MIVVNLGLVACRKFIVVVEEVGFSDTIQVPIALCRCYGNLIPVHIPYHTYTAAWMLPLQASLCSADSSLLC